MRKMVVAGKKWDGSRYAVCNIRIVLAIDDVFWWFLLVLYGNNGCG